MGNLGADELARGGEKGREGTERRECLVVHFTEFYYGPGTRADKRWQWLSKQRASHTT